MPERAEVLRLFIHQLTHELAGLVGSARAAHEAATHEETKAEDRHDTFAIEASYLAAGQSERVLELQKTKAELEAYLSGSPKTDRVQPGGLVRFESDEGTRLVLVTRSGGGLRISIGGIQIQTLSTDSPLGNELLGLREGEEFETEIRGQMRAFRILRIA